MHKIELDTNGNLGKHLEIRKYRNHMNILILKNNSMFKINRRCIRGFIFLLIHRWFQHINSQNISNNSRHILKDALELREEKESFQSPTKSALKIKTKNFHELLALWKEREAHEIETNKIGKAKKYDDVKSSNSLQEDDTIGMMKLRDTDQVGGKNELRVQVDSIEDEDTPTRDDPIVEKEKKNENSKGISEFSPMEPLIQPDGGSTPVNSPSPDEESLEEKLKKRGYVKVKKKNGKKTIEQAEKQIKILIEGIKQTTNIEEQYLSWTKQIQFSPKELEKCIRNCALLPEKLKKKGYFKEFQHAIASKLFDFLYQSVQGNDSYIHREEKLRAWKKNNPKSSPEEYFKQTDGKVTKDGISTCFWHGLRENILEEVNDYKKKFIKQEAWKYEIKLNYRTLKKCTKMSLKCLKVLSKENTKIDIPSRNQMDQESWDDINKAMTKCFPSPPSKDVLIHCYKKEVIGK